MHSFQCFLPCLGRDTRGQDLTEYALSTAVIALLAAAAIKGCGAAAQNALLGLVNNLSSKF
jgi:hypothetical protein